MNLRCDGEKGWFLCGRPQWIKKAVSQVSMIANNQHSKRISDELTPLSSELTGRKTYRNLIAQDKIAFR